jgi:hypothetical protein
MGSRRFVLIHRLTVVRQYCFRNGSPRRCTEIGRFEPTRIVTEFVGQRMKQERMAPTKADTILK